MSNIQVYQNSYGETWPITLQKDSGASVDITGYTSVQALLWNQSVSPPTSSTSSNAPTVVSNNPAQVSWQPSVTDLATLGDFTLQIVVNTTGGPRKFRGLAFSIVPF